MGSNMGKIHLNTKILKWARESNNLTIIEVANKMKIKPEKLTSWELGNEYPTYIQLEKLAYQILKYPIAIFFLPETPVISDPRINFRTLPDSIYENIPSEIIKLFRKGQILQYNLKELNNEKNPSKKLIFNDISIIKPDQIETSIDKIRRYLGISINEQISWKDPDIALKEWRDTIENVGIFVFKDAFHNDGFSGFSLFDDIFPIIFINNTMPKTRQIFTLFHELIHILLKTAGIDIKNDEDILYALNPEQSKIEKMCNIYANRIILPYSHFNDLITNIYNFDDYNINNLANKFKVSREVILRRLLDMNKINHKYYEEKRNEWNSQVIKRRPKVSGGNYYSNKIIYLGKNYMNIVFKEFYNHKINEYKVSEYLDIKIDNISNLELKFHGGG